MTFCMSCVYRCPQNSEDVGSSRTIVIGSCELSCVGIEPRPSTRAVRALTDDPVL